MTAEVETAPPRRRAFGLARDWWAGTTLASRLVGIVTVLLAVGLVLAGATSAALLEGTLVAQVDAKLQSEGKVVAEQRLSELDLTGRSLYTPSDYYLRYAVDGDELPVLSETTEAQYGTPEVPTIGIAEARARHGEPFTVSSTKPGSQWRAVAYNFSMRDGTVGTAVIALPLADIARTVRHMSVVLLLSGLGILLLGAAAGTWAVRRSLKPLREIETTAAAIADGDLSRRVPAASEHTEVGRLSAALNGMLAQIEKAFGAQTASEARMRRFVADASHELRTPLATIRGYGELYRMGALTTTDQVDDTMRRIEQSATRMGALVEDLLALARLDEGRPMRTGPVDLTVLAADAVSDLHALDPARATRLVPLVEGADGAPCVVVGEEPRLRQVVANLVGNAVQHTPPGTPVEIAVGHLPSGEGAIEVRDHGPGIDPEHAARVFERFYRVDASRGRDSGGAGLGMAIVAAIVDAHDGTVRLAQTPGGGTTVQIALPVPAHDPQV
ncbi:cell wall metabolism sensor histidine kinase WalK [Cellulomonas sp. Leaf334]|uniref:sensor histidine kinase n=1 Tax=Cellulomonas sp. Leaf334 TaxID=1736339 RepID=UPI0006F88BD9|nr:HAMP domain-containing sensor histidine kinase [Cellulomonas sp. Leaf334]KQR12051.1 histidine kinase [Cellulomonas sp. Leaf334]